MSPKGPDVSGRSLRFLLLAIVIELFCVVFALTASGTSGPGWQGFVFIIGVVGLVIAFLAVGMRDQA